MQRKIILLSVLILGFMVPPSWSNEPCADNEPCSEKLPSLTAGEVKKISYDEFKQIMEEEPAIKIFDVRSKSAYDQGHIPGTLFLAFEDIKADKLSQLIDHEETVIVYCSSASCHMSQNAARKMIGLGYQVIDYNGGVAEWVAKGGSLEKSK